MYDQIVGEVCTGIWAIFNKPNYQITFNLITNGQFGYILRIVSFSIHPPHDLTNFTRSYDKLLKYITGVKAYLDVSLGWATGVHDLRHVEGHVEVGKCLENTNSALPDIPQDVKFPQAHTV